MPDRPGPYTRLMLRLVHTERWHWRWMCCSHLSHRLRLPCIRPWGWQYRCARHNHRCAFGAADCPWEVARA